MQRAPRRPSPRPFPNGGFPNSVDALLIGPNSAAAASNAGASSCILALPNLARGPAMLMTPIASLRWNTGAAMADMPGAKTSSIIA